MVFINPEHVTSVYQEAPVGPNVGPGNIAIVLVNAIGYQLDGNKYKIDQVVDLLLTGKSLN